MSDVSEHTRAGRFAETIPSPNECRPQSPAVMGITNEFKLAGVDVSAIIRCLHRQMLVIHFVECDAKVNMTRSDGYKAWSYRYDDKAGRGGYADCRGR
ncbi:MAG: hypothetical protein JOY71_29775 [Acetobacteraceae bacterium]|nr:hypothetical protein [Acetobacteraceae bacterium]